MSMKLKTRDFGEIEVNENDVVTFQEPVFGFEAYRKYVFLYHQEISEHFAWLQSIEEADLCFILADPALVTDHYQPEIPQKTQELLGDEDYMCWLITVLRDDFAESTINLKSPIVVNPTRRLASQIILEENLPIAYPLVKREGDEG